MAAGVLHGLGRTIRIERHSLGRWPIRCSSRPAPLREPATLERAQTLGRSRAGLQARRAGAHERRRITFGRDWPPLPGCLAVRERTAPFRACRSVTQRAAAQTSMISRYTLRPRATKKLRRKLRGFFRVRPAWALSCGCNSRREEVILIEANRNWGRATDRGKEAGSEAAVRCKRTGSEAVPTGASGHVTAKLR